MLRAQLGVFARHPLQQRPPRDGIARLAPVERIDDAALGTVVEAQPEVTPEVGSADLPALGASAVQVEDNASHRQERQSVEQGKSRSVNRDVGRSSIFKKKN